MAWSRAFDDPIRVSGGRVLRTLHDAGHYPTSLPKAVQQSTEWQTATEMLILAAQGQRPIMFADIAMRQALPERRLGKPAARRRSFANVRPLQV